MKMVNTLRFTGNAIVQLAEHVKSPKTFAVKATKEWSIVSISYVHVSMDQHSNIIIGKSLIKHFL